MKKARVGLIIDDKLQPWNIFSNDSVIMKNSHTFHPPDKDLA